jgi:hypothetical protein
MTKTITIAAIAMVAVVIGMGLIAPALAVKQDKVEICHVTTDPANPIVLIEVSGNSLGAHLAHGDFLPTISGTGNVLIGCVTDFIIDADGIATPLRGISPATVTVFIGAALTSFPSFPNPNAEGLDWFDNDGDGAWTIGVDAIHIERNPNGACSTAIPDAFYDLGSDCVLVDIGNNLVDRLHVSCDLENSSFCSPAQLAAFKYHDADGDGLYDLGEDLVLDNNNDGFFN